jgi:hypothetical protein
MANLEFEVPAGASSLRARRAGVKVISVETEIRDGIKVLHVVVAFSKKRFKLQEDFNMGFSIYNPTGTKVFWFLHGLAHPPRPVYDQSLLVKLAKDKNAVVIAPCAPCHGLTSAVHGDTAFEQTLIWQVRLMDYLEVEECLIMGHSMGAALAIFLHDRLWFTDRGRLLAKDPIAFMLPSGLPWLDHRPVNPAVAAVLLSALVPDAAIHWGVAAADAVADNDAARFVTGLKFIKDHPLDLSGAVNVMLTAPSLDDVLQRLRAEGVYPRIGYALYDWAIWAPVHKLRTPNVVFFPGFHASLLHTWSRAYRAFGEQIDLALAGAAPDRDQSLVSAAWTVALAPVAITASVAGRAWGAISP